MENLIKWFPSLAPIIKNPIVAVVLLVIGFVFLIKGADFFVDGSSGVAKKLRVPSIIIGLTVVAMGTSLPELASSVSAGLKGSDTMAISNVIGSNLFNLLVVVGMCAIMSPVVVQKDVARRDIPISIGAAVLLLVLSVIGVGLERIDAIILVVLFVVFIVSLVLIALKARKSGEDSEEEDDEIKDRPIWLCLILIVGGALAIMVGGDVVVTSATNIAYAFNMSETLVGLTIVAVGTSLPELVTSVVAARKNEVELSLGNAIGSNIFNILLILGVAGTISPLALVPDNIIDIGVLIAVSVLVAVVSLTKKKLGRFMGILMVSTYVAYVVYIVLRAMPFGG